MMDLQFLKGRLQIGILDPLGLVGDALEVQNKARWRRDSVQYQELLTMDEKSSRNRICGVTHSSMYSNSSTRPA